MNFSCLSLPFLVWSMSNNGLYFDSNNSVLLSYHKAPKVILVLFSPSLLLFPFSPFEQCHGIWLSTKSMFLNWCGDEALWHLSRDNLVTDEKAKHIIFWLFFSFASLLLCFLTHIATVQCSGCRQHHKLVDNLGLVVEYDFREEMDSDSNANRC